MEEAYERCLLAPKFNLSAALCCGYRLLVLLDPYTCRFGFCAKQESLPRTPRSVGQVETRARRAFGPNSESDPISLEALQEGIKNFELRRDTDGEPPNAASAAAEVERRARGAIKF